ncbi:hypothetical protein WJX81_006787 [Elliptochloris bilobata]|uniref:Uncharacterized protein n=1 Tax=Elliptochloris bilobata TaxID=381761 RepID=A0AAW1S0K2_9CHLO
MPASSTTTVSLDQGGPQAERCEVPARQKFKSLVAIYEAAAALHAMANTLPEGHGGRATRGSRAVLASGVPPAVEPQAGDTLPGKPPTSALAAWDPESPLRRTRGAVDGASRPSRGAADPESRQGQQAGSEAQPQTWASAVERLLGTVESVCCADCGSAAQLALDDARSAQAAAAARLAEDAAAVVHSSRRVEELQRDLDAATERARVERACLDASRAQKAAADAAVEEARAAQQQQRRQGLASLAEQRSHLLLTGGRGAALGSV